MAADLDALLGAYYQAVTQHMGSTADAVVAIRMAAADPDFSAAMNARLSELEALANTCGGEAGLQGRCFVSSIHLQAIKEALS